MDEDHKSEGPTVWSADGWASAAPAAPGPPDSTAAPVGTGAGSPGWMSGPPPPPPGAPGGPSGWGQWAGAPGPVWVASPTPQAHGRRAPTIVLVVVLVLIGMAAGFGIGHVAWQSSSTSVPLPSSGSPSSGSGSFPFGSGTFPFGSGTSPFGSGTFPFGSGSFPFGSGGFPFGSGSPGSSSTASGGPSNPSAIAARVDPGLVDVNTTLSYLSEQAAGTGIVLTSGGEVLTNNHVIDGATSISVTDLGNGRVYAARVVGYSRSSDIAVLQLQGASGLKVAPLGDSSTLRVGEAVVGIGNAGGAGGTPSVAGGSVTALDQSITATEQDGGNPESLTGLIEVNADIQAGDSGGPLVDTGGKVVGMDTAASAGFSLQTTGTDGYAIPINSAVAIALKITSGNASATVHVGPTAFLGVQVYSTPSGSSPSGALIHLVVPGAPAASAGLAAGDVITSLGGKRVDSAPALTSLMQRYHPGDRVHVSWTDSTGHRHGTSLQLASGPPA
ncbi:MAG: S1C family serine protease [Acidimicrobiales bacterium]